MVLLRPCYVKDGKGRCIAADSPKWRSVQLELDDLIGVPIWNNDVRNGRFKKDLYKHFKIRDIVQRDHNPRVRGNVPTEGTSSSSRPQDPVRSPPGYTFTTPRIYTESSESEGSDGSDGSDADEWTPYREIPLETNSVLFCFFFLISYRSNRITLKQFTWLILLKEF